MTLGKAFLNVHWYFQYSCLPRLYSFIPHMFLDRLNGHLFPVEDARSQGGFSLCLLKYLWEVLHLTRTGWGGSPGWKHCYGCDWPARYQSRSWCRPCQCSSAASRLHQAFHRSVPIVMHPHLCLTYRLLRCTDTKGISNIQLIPFFVAHPKILWRHSIRLFVFPLDVAIFNWKS